VKVTNEKTENSQAFLTIEMEPSEVEESLGEAFRRLTKKTRVPGFRKGKAPRDILERYIGKESLLEDALNSLIPQAYENAIKKQEIKAVARPEIEITQTEPVIFKAVVPLMPEVELGDYHKIRVKREPVDVSEDEVNNTIEQLRHQQATWEPADRLVDFSDLATLDIEGNVEGQDEPFISQKGVQYHIIQGLPLPIPGFAEQLPGMKIDEEKEFKLQFPSDYSKSELAGKEASFKVKIVGIKQEKLPELNDEFAKGISPEFETLEALRERISDNLKLRAEEQARVNFEEQVIKAVVDISKAEFPPILVEAEIDQLISHQARRWQMEGGNLEEYLKSINKTAEALREDLKPPASERVTQSLVLGKISDEEKIEVTDAEIDNEVEVITKDTEEPRKVELKKFLDTPRARESIKETLITRKTIQRLLEIAGGSGEE